MKKRIIYEEDTNFREENPDENEGWTIFSPKRMANQFYVIHYVII